MIKAFRFIPTPNKTYATEANAIKAVEAKYAKADCFGGADVHYVIMTNDDGRFFPVFFGERALQNGVHFNFNVMA